MTDIKFMMPGFGFSFSRDRSRRAKRRLRAQNAQLSQRVRNLEQQLLFERLRNTRPTVQINNNNYGNVYNGFNNQYLNNSSAFYNSNTLNAVAGMGTGRGDLVALSSAVGRSTAMAAGGSAHYNAFHAVSYAHGQSFA
jgi:hypothetical protein